MTEGKDVPGILFHYSCEELASYAFCEHAEELLSEAVRNDITAHLEVCSECREILEWAKEFTMITDEELGAEIAELKEEPLPPMPLNLGDGILVDRTASGQRKNRQLVMYTNGITAERLANSRQWTARHVQVHLVGEGKTADEAAESLVDQTSECYLDFLEFQGTTGWHVTIDKAFAEAHGRQWIQEFSRIQRIR